MEYKVAILDDEFLMREGLELKYPFKENRFKIVFSGDDGNILLQKIEKNEIEPDLIFVDIIMPKLNGLNFIKQLTEIYNDVDIVVVSGFDDFHFAQQAIRLGVKEYLLKPINPMELENVMNRMKDSLKKQKEEEISEHLAEVNNWVMHKNSFELNKSSFNFVKNLLVEYPNLYIVLQGNLKSEPQPLYDTGTNLSFPIKYSGFNNLFIHFDKQNLFPDLLSKYTNKTITALHFTNLNRVEDFPHCMTFALNFIKLNLTLGKRIFHTVKWDKDLIEQKGIEFDEQHQNLLRSFHNEKDREKGFMMLKKLLCKQMPQRQKEEAVKNFAREYFQMEVSDEWLQSYESPEEFSYDCIYFLKNLGDFPPPASGKEILYCVLNDFKKEYSLKISLKDYADRYHIHPNHLIRLFKKEMNTTFNDSLTKIRIDRAKDDLIYTQKKIHDIALDIGYEDARYFSQVFKKNLNMTPNEYRKRFQGG